MSDKMILPRRHPCRREAQGFTLVELITVIVLMGIMSASFMIFFKPTIDGYFDARRRADLTDIADTALRKMNQDIKKAVPNSVFVFDSTTAGDGTACFQLVPTVGGGRYRTGPDTVNDDATCPASGVCSAYPDESAAAGTAQTFDVLLSGGQAPVLNAVVVINNQNGDDVYGGQSRATVTSAVAAPPRAGFGTHRVTISRNPAAGGYAGGRYLLVAAAEPSVIYSCSGGRLFRVNTGSFSKASACPTTGDLLATDVASCEFIYDPSIGATQQSGFLWMTLAISRSGEAVRLAYGAHVDNQP